ncbi:major capsid protein E [Gulosibacter macacae]|uniref:Major capsid protein E n=1 Tax=Gulosibacter macacae TaxID=2488791 RepID=A0A3P3VUA4_9MICO|nr:major capsid protein [Gulosibacter macacae]RRJ85907.1 major capsid protein E [Gulosibacter macacae]
MATLWTELIDPAELTGYVREALADIEARKSSLAHFLPNRTVNDIVVRFKAGQAGLVAEAQFRAFDAEPEIGKGEGGKRYTLELPAIGQNQIISEYDQLRVRNADNEDILTEALSTTRQVAQAVSDRIERLRGIVLSTGKATIPEIGSADDFGRKASHTVTAANLWSTGSTVSRLADLQAWSDVYEATNGVAPGAIIMSRKAYRLLAAGDEFKTNLVGGGSRPASAAEINSLVEGAGLPPIEVYTRRTSAGLILGENELLLLPAPVDVDAWEDAPLGATFWGRTLTSSDPKFQLEGDAPGIVAGVYRGEKPPMLAEVVSDAIAMPVLANANLSLKATVAA